MTSPSAYPPPGPATPDQDPPTGPIPVIPTGVPPGAIDSVPPTSQALACRPGTDLEPVQASGPPRWLDRVGSSPRWPEIVTQTQPSLTDVIAEAHEPTPGQESSPPWEPMWTYAVRLPLVARANAAVWATKNPARAAVYTAAVLVVVYLAGFLPYVGPVLDWIMPRVLNPHAW
jgi:hypothetical protein